MKRFDFGDKKKKDDPKYFFEDFEDDIIDVANVGIFKDDLNQRQLELCIKIAEKSFFWRFRTIKYKLKTIEKVYKTLSLIMEKKDADL